MKSSRLRRLLATLAGKRRQLIYQVALENIGYEASPLDRVDDDVACAESVTEILNRAIGFPIITGTWTLNDSLQRNRQWAPTQTPGPGDIIISPTGMHKRKTNIRNGHVGIVGKNGIVMSNDSHTGKWMANYTIATWRQRYEAQGTYPVFFYTLV